MAGNKLLFIAALVLTALILENAYSLDFNSLADQSSYRCSEAVVSIGDLDRSVRQKCGDPSDIASVPDFGPIWIYPGKDGKFMYYLEFVNGTLQRIVSAPCSINDPSCFDLR